MKMLTLRNAILLASFMSLSYKNLYAQDQNLTLIQDEKFEQLLNEKRKINSSITVNDRYKIQIYNGDSETAKKTLGEFRKEFKNYDGTIVFNTPTYKVWVGNFKTRIESERNLAELKKRYPTAFLIKPNK
ncbi:SPOR domain-containing protein [Flavobacterium sp. CYK-4]|uniref:SPOR domain-containing protein n=1 Tax=Flavobacterium lotistagni TaxID=2709660 RepID=UPI0014085772|nr:SPOR domain-containing protein [Flavobacterium lotistagni]NHM05862.1 SPOR domain-containing protein [Flavobacterium lotistagni]